MTVRKFKTCACGHADSFHEMAGKKRGRCLYGVGIATTVVPCSCAKFHRRASAASYVEGSAAVQAALASGESRVLAALDRIISGFQELRAVLPMRAAPGPLPMTPYLEPVRRERELRSRGVHAKHVETGARPKLADGPRLPKGAQRMLDVLASHPAKSLTKTQLGTLAGAPATKGTFRTYYALLKQHRYVQDAEEKRVELLAAGRERAVARGFAETRAEILATWAPKLAAGARRLLDMVVERGPLSKESLGQLTGIDPAKGTWRTYMAKLKSNQLIAVDGSTVSMGEALEKAN